MEKPNGAKIIRAQTARNQKKVDALLKRGYSIRQITRELLRGELIHGGGIVPLIPQSGKLLHLILHNPAVWRCTAVGC